MEPVHPYTVTVETTDLDEARAVCGDQLYPRTMRLVDPAVPFRAHFAFLHLGAMSLADVRYGAEVSGGCQDLGAYHVNLALSGRFAARQGRRPITGSQGRAAVYRPVGATTLDRSSADCRLLALKIDRLALEHQLAVLLDADVRGPVRLSEGFDPLLPPGRFCADLIRVLGEEIRDPAGLAHQPIMVEPLQESLMTALLYSVGHQYTDELHARVPRSPGHTVVRAIDAIHSHPDRPHTVSGLAAIAGLSVRSLRQEFHLRVGMTPMAYLRQVRLARAHADLMAAEPGLTSVDAVARRWGFARPAVFTASYLARYHTTPGRTLLAAGASEP